MPRKIAAGLAALRQKGMAAAADGGAYFHVNETPLPTYQVPGALVTHGDGSQSDRAEAEFDSVLLAMGENDFHFAVRSTGGGDWCVHPHSVVSLVSAPLGLKKSVFDVWRNGCRRASETAGV